LAVLGLGAVLAGVVYTFWDQIKSRLDAEPVEDVVRQPRRPVRRQPEPPVVARPEPVKRVPERRPEPVRRGVDSALIVRERNTASSFSRRADGALKELDFANAAELFGKAASTLRHDPDGAAKAKGLATKAETFLFLTKDSEPNPVANNTLVTLKRHSGNHIKDVVLVDETNDAYVVARRGGKFNVPKRDVRSVERMSPERQRARLLAEFEALEEKASKKDPSSARYFALADRALRDGIKEKALTYLEKAYARDGADLPKQLRIAEAKRFLSQAIWCDSTGRTSTAKIYCRKVARLYGDLPEQVADARELLEKLTKPVVVVNYQSTVRIKVRKTAARSSTGGDAAPEDEEATVVAKKVSSNSAKNVKLMAEINEVFDEAMDHYIKGRPGNMNSNKHLHQAATLFDRVVKLCDKAEANDPGNSQILSRQADASKYAYHSRKMTTL
jgi:tetratricopeptide (TPR) repeat protein